MEVIRIVKYIKKDNCTDCDQEAREIEQFHRMSGFSASEGSGELLEGWYFDEEYDKNANKQ